MNNQNWISLNEFSTKHKVSLSTLRRRIRTGELENRFQSGKYWLRDEPVAKYIKSYMRTEAYQLPVAERPKIEQPKIKTVMGNSPIQEIQTIGGTPNLEDQVLSELKSAYVAALHEKEVQIMQLKEEVTNLKTLVKILESENDRLTSNMKESAPIDTWIS